MEGSIPPGGWPLLASLTGLFLDGNNISGPIPEDFPLPEVLLVLLLPSNQLSALPKRSFLPPSLTVLWVSNCGWASRVPVLLGRHLWFGGSTLAVCLPCCHPAATLGSLGAPEHLPLQLSDNLLANDISDLADWHWPTTACTARCRRRLLQPCRVACRWALMYGCYSLGPSLADAGLLDSRAQQHSPGVADIPSL